jgi:flap endonuclease-1
MGIKGLNVIIKKHTCAIKEINISEFAFKKVAIDTSLFLYKYKAIFRDKWISCFIQLVSCLRKNDVHCVFIFDGQSPVEKQKEREERRSSRQKIEEKYKQLEADLQYYKISGEVTELLVETQDKYTTTLQNRLLGGIKNSNISVSKKINVSCIEEHIEKLKGQVISISKDDICLIKTFLEVVNVPYIQAEGEAESYCSYLCNWGIVDSVLTDDTDVLVYGTPLFIFDINSSSGNCKMININELLNEFDLSYESFRDLCIMCGCDYNSNIKSVGQETSYKLIKEYKTIDNLPEKYDKTILNHVRVRELFTVPEKQKVNLGYCGIPNKQEFYQFMFENNIKLDFESIFSNFYKKITFVD